ncbi:MAG: TRAP transporter small permease [Desulfovibrionaceae bacterium]|nr:TRAP transporter small permease [Desulfovibrionaceae bacterium]
MESRCIIPENGKAGGLAVLDRVVVASLRVICVTCFAVLFLLLSGNVFVRYVPVAAFFWFDEVVEWAFAWMVFFGAAALWARDEHFRLSWVGDKLEGTLRGHLLSILVEILSLLFIAVFFYQSFRLTSMARDWTPVFNIPRACLYICMPVSGAIMVGYSLRNLWREVRKIRTLQEGDEIR